MVDGKNEPREQADVAEGDLSAPSPRNAPALIHELRTCQVELEMRDEELRRAGNELTEVRGSFADLYDFAPVGYVTISDKGIILQANLTLANLLRVDRGRLIHDHFARFIAPKDSDRWHLHLADVLKHQRRKRCALALRRDDGSCLHAQLDCLRVLSDGGSAIRIALTDTSERKQLEEKRDLLLEENRGLVRRLIQVQEEERRLLARTLHDDLGQLLTSIDTRATYIARHADDADLRTMAGEIIRDIKTSFDASQAMLLKLRPGTLDVMGLAAALTELAGQWEKLAEMDCSLYVDGDIDHLDDMYAIAIYRLVQEGLTNACRHGKAHRVEILVRNAPPHAGRPACVLVEISDNGKGLHVQKAHEGLGIIGMRERVRALGGTFLLTDHPRDGVRIEAMLPLDGGPLDGGEDS